MKRCLELELVLHLQGPRGFEKVLCRAVAYLNCSQEVLQPLLPEEAVMIDH